LFTSSTTTDHQSTERPLQLSLTAIQIHPRRSSSSHKQPRPESCPARSNCDLSDLFRTHTRRLPALRRCRARPRQSDQRQRPHHQLPRRATRVQIAICRAQTHKRRAGPCSRPLRTAGQEAAHEPDAGEPILGCCDANRRRSRKLESAVQNIESKLCCRAERCE